ncbi:ribosome-recycling factor [Thiohalorhabdus denitrificans]|uniref:Ribosome-recycling factor n=1 Tax=Thiohalorhabdus denitrificans TaxID=381306 RepID=A0A0P9C9F7_9GAMM|nr:ribosome recycling factor [Thiohalorhabdus denitrificans]KPV41720.1 ribosome-recycling factor [Thiohalorhabdus denitrificans]SCY54454.1 ribosome recycling factor [Thiohalorhabdus denitrificans]
MIEEIELDAEDRMQKSIEALKDDLSKVRTGRAHASVLDPVTVEYYGSEVPLYQVANMAVPDARTITIKPYEKDMIPKIERAIHNADLGLNPSASSDVVRVPMPELTEERRKELAKHVRQMGEGTRVAIRNVRRDANQDLKKLEKDGDAGEDEVRRAEKEIQELTDRYVAEVDAILDAKEADLMEV